jgi:hypothetical protein
MDSDRESDREDEPQNEGPVLSPAEQDKKVFEIAQKAIDEVEVFLKDMREYVIPAPRRDDHTEDGFRGKQAQMDEYRDRLESTARYVENREKARVGGAREENMQLQRQKAELFDFYAQQLKYAREADEYGRGTVSPTPLLSKERIFPETPK